MGKILLIRENNYLGIAQQYNIFLDNKKIGKIKNGQQLEIEVDNGNHELYLNNSILSLGLKSNTLFFKTSNTSVVRILVKSIMSKLSGIKLELISNEKDPLDYSDDKYISLEKIYKLKEKKIISNEEYEKQKKKILKGE